MSVRVGVSVSVAVYVLIMRKFVERVNQNHVFVCVVDCTELHHVIYKII